MREQNPIGVIIVGAPETRSVSRRPGRAPPDLRRPGGHRHRERAPVQRAAGAQPRPRPMRSSSRPRPARSCASSARRRRTCSPCSTPSPPTRCASATRFSAASYRSTASSSTSARWQHRPVASRRFATAYPVPPSRGRHHATRDPDPRHRAHAGHPDRARVRLPRRGSRDGLPQRALGADAARRRSRSAPLRLRATSRAVPGRRRSRCSRRSPTRP